MTPPAGKKQGGSTTLDEAISAPPEAPPLAAPEPSPESPGEAPESAGGAAPAPAPPAQPASRESAGSTPARPQIPTLPSSKVKSGALLDEKTVTIHGPAGIGKSTIASEWAGGNIFLLDCAGELNDLDVYKSGTDGQPPIIDWTTFRAYCAAIVQAQDKFDGYCIDTGDQLAMYCSQAVRKRFGIVHESDAEWGKGWSMVREEFQSHLAKLAAIPNKALIIIAHTQEVKIETRSAEWIKHIPSLTKGPREAAVNMSDLVLYLDWADDEHEDRVIRTKPSRYWEAKERGQNPRLPAEIPWPVDTSGYAILRAAWEKAGGE